MPSLTSWLPPGGAAIFATYFLYVMLNTCGGALLPAIIVQVGFSDGEAATIAGVQTLAQALGKLTVAGWLADTLGGRRCYALTMLCTAGATLGYAFGQTAVAVGAAAFCVEFCSTPSYPAHVHFVRNRFDSTRAPTSSGARVAAHGGSGTGGATAGVDRTGDGFWLLGLASRMGDVTSKLGYGAALAALGGAAAYRSVVFGGAALGVGAALLGLACHREPAKAPEAAAAGGGGASLWSGALRSADFRLGAAALGSVCAVKRTGELLLGVYFAATAAEGLCDAACGMKLAATWSAGVACSVLLGGRAFNAAVCVRTKLRLAAALNATSALAALALALLSRQRAATAGQLDLRAALVFVAAAGIGLSYYIPAGLFAVAFGGARAGTVSAHLDALSFGLSSAVLVALRFVLDSPSALGGWAGVWLVLAALQAAATVLVHRFLRATLCGDVRPLLDSACSGTAGSEEEERAGLLAEAAVMEVEVS